MNIFDLIIIITVAAGLIFGLINGLIKELAGLVAIFVGFYISKLFAPAAGAWLVKFTGISDAVSVPVACLIIFVLVIILLHIFSSLLTRLLNAASLGGINRLLGGIFGIIKTALIISVLLNVFDSLDKKYNFVEPEVKTRSFAYQYALGLAPALWNEAVKQQ